MKKSKKTHRGFNQLCYKGIPITFRPDVSTGVLYFYSHNRADDEKVIWTMRCMANDIEGKITWPWSRLVWRIKRWLSGKQQK